MDPDPETQLKRPILFQMGGALPPGGSSGSGRPILRLGAAPGGGGIPADCGAGAPGGGGRHRSSDPTEGLQEARGPGPAFYPH
jgi:hypothetical protein